MSTSEEEKLVWLANHENVDELWQWILTEKKKAMDDPTTISNIPPTLYLGRDTRIHSEGFRNAMVPMAQALGAQVVDLGVVTTPILHHSVLHANYIRYLPKTLIPHRPKVAGYMDLLAYSYVSLLQTHTKKQSSSSVSTTRTLLVDCACGVGYPALEALLNRVNAIEPGIRDIQPTNGPDMGPLNDKCGSEHVQKGICPPRWYESTATLTAKSYCASFDGDADRIVFFDNSSEKDFLLFDGDKITCLLCGFIQEQLKVIQGAPNFPNLKLGVVQTAYANGASTAFLEKMLGKDAVCIAKTGVKHLHAATHEHFDVGIYFEANGHGTVLFGPEFYRAVDIAQQNYLFTAHHGQEKDVAACTAIQRLSLLPSLVNQAVGDALSDLLLVDVILSLNNWSLRDWHNLYQDCKTSQGMDEWQSPLLYLLLSHISLCCSSTMNLQTPVARSRCVSRIAPLFKPTKTKPNVFPLRMYNKSSMRPCRT